MLTTYRRVLSLPGALVFSLSGLVARLPISMVSLGIVLLVSTRTGSYSLAGTVSAAYLIANAFFAVLQARLIDRLGQRRVLPVSVGVFALGLVAMMAAVEADVRAPWPHLCAALSGAAMPQIGSCVRARWSLLVPDKQDLHTAFAFEAVADETVFILGPALVTVLATTVHPLAGLATAVLAAVAGTAVLVGQRRTEPPPSGATRRHGSGPMPWPVLVPLIACAFTMGALLGGAEVATVAFSDELGAKPLSGLMLALWALGSLLSGVITGALRQKASNATRFRWGMLALGAADAAAAVRGRVRLARGVPVPLGLRDLADAHRQLRLDRGDRAGGPADRGHHAVHHGSRRRPGTRRRTRRPGRRHVGRVGQLLGDRGRGTARRGARVRRGPRHRGATIAHRIVFVSAAPVVRTSSRSVTGR